MIRQGFITNSSSSSFIFFTKGKVIDAAFLKEIGFTSVTHWETGAKLADVEDLVHHLGKHLESLTPYTILEIAGTISSLEERMKELQQGDNKLYFRNEESRLQYELDSYYAIRSALYNFDCTWFQYEGGDNHGDTSDIGMSMDYQIQEGIPFKKDGVGGMIKISRH
jgi:hypothetical protein